MERSNILASHTCDSYDYYDPSEGTFSAVNLSYRTASAISSRAASGCCVPIRWVKKFGLVEVFHAGVSKRLLSRSGAIVE